MTSPQTILFILSVCFYIGGSAAQSNPDDVCLPLKDCPTRSSMSKAEIRKRECAREGRMIKIYCTVKCVTPENEPGVCKIANECEPFMQIVTNSNTNNIETAEYLRKFICYDIATEQNDYACCTHNKHFTKKPTTTTTTQRAITWTTPTRKPKPIAPYESCGIESDGYRVKGGSEAEIGQHPWVALLQYFDTRGTQTSARCGGTLISRRYVLTAAHCVTDRYGKLTRVALGEHRISTALDCYGKSCAPKPQIIKIEKTIQHPGWQYAVRQQFYDDIALLRLASNAQFTDFVKPICLPALNEKPAMHDALTVAGWGNADDGKKSDVKRLATLYRQPAHACQKTVSVDINNKQLCVGGSVQDSCRGDSGGPLMFPKIDALNGITTWYLVGVVSFGYECGSIGRPGIYTSVSNYVQWINENMD